MIAVATNLLLKTGLPKSTISEVLARKKTFTRQMIRKLADYFHVDIGVQTANISMRNKDLSSLFRENSFVFQPPGDRDGSAGLDSGGSAANARAPGVRRHPAIHHSMLKSRVTHC